MKKSEQVVDYGIGKIIKACVELFNGKCEVVGQTFEDTTYRLTMPEELLQGRISFTDSIQKIIKAVIPNAMCMINNIKRKKGDIILDVHILVTDDMAHLTKDIGDDDIEDLLRKKMGSVYKKVDVISVEKQVQKFVNTYVQLIAHRLGIKVGKDVCTAVEDGFIVGLAISKKMNADELLQILKNVFDKRYGNENVEVEKPCDYKKDIIYGIKVRTDLNNVLYNIYNPYTVLEAAASLSSFLPHLSKAKVKRDNVKLKILTPVNMIDIVGFMSNINYRYKWENIISVDKNDITISTKTETLY